MVLVVLVENIMVEEPLDGAVIVQEVMEANLEMKMITILLETKEQLF
jgi:hypothetical protein